MTRSILWILLPLVLLGNGLRSVISSTVFVSEGNFASFLNISVNQTSVILELLLGAVLLSLLITPRLRLTFGTRQLATVMCAAAGLASLGLAALFWISPSVVVREIFVIILFPLIGFSLASLAPLAQVMTGWGGDKYEKFLTGVWAVAMPAAFLVTPQLVKIVAPRFGLDVYFVGFALFPLLLIPLIWSKKIDLDNQEVEITATKPIFPLVPALICLAGFQISTIFITLFGIGDVKSQIGLGVFALTIIYFVQSLRRGRDPGKKQSGNGYVISVFAILFLINIPTTGFYDTAYLVAHSCSNTLIADRATFGALIQLLAATATAAILARYALKNEMIFLGCLLATLGVGTYLLYINYPFVPVYFVSKAIVGLGMGILTTSAIFAVSHSSQGSSLSLLIAFVIIIGTEVGLELFEVTFQVSEILGSSLDGSYSLIFALQLAFAVMAFLLALRMLLVKSGDDQTV